MKFLSLLLTVGLFQVNAQFEVKSLEGEIENPVDLVNSLLAAGNSLTIDESSVTLTGPSDTCAKAFSGGLSLVPDSNLFFEEGIILATGTPRFIENQDSHAHSKCFEDDPSGGDPVLTALLNEDTYDACVLEFRFKPGADQISLNFNYAFGSEEYLEWVASEFNDAFVLLLNDVNIAIVPGTADTAVSINNVNEDVNSDYYVNNDPQKLDPVPYPYFEADGFTKKLQATGSLIPDDWNTLSFRIADTSDCRLDSWVMVEAGTLEGSTDPPPTVPPTPTPTQLPTGGVSGDPHFIMWSGEKYDFHGVCDLVLLENPAFGLGKGMDIHVRTKKTRRWSYISSAVLKIGEDTFEVKRGGYWLNGEKDASLESGIAGYPIKFKLVNADHNQVQYVVPISSSESIKFKTFGDMIRVDVESLTGENFKDSHGLMGTYGNDSERVGRDHTSVFHDFDEFGKEWQVRPEESNLFHNVEGPQAPEECKMPGLSTGRRRLGEQKVSMADAEIACARLSGNDRDMCIFDVLAIDDTDVAGAY